MTLDFALFVNHFMRARQLLAQHAALSTLHASANAVWDAISNARDAGQA